MTRLKGSGFGGKYSAEATPFVSCTITFSEPGIHYYICTPHPWMYGQVIVE